ncbi:MAG TPA: ATP-binding protein, partial [Opitutaceae bacterium]|nr:ATP-binding protein [Opitutaceae bacterium]
MPTDTPGHFPKILHLEDNPADAELIHLQLKQEWPGCAIHRVMRREEFQAALQHEAFDLILSDFSLPAFNGLEALALVQKTGTATPFVFLSGTIGEDNAVQALKCGAADYIIKDRPARLVSAIRQALTHVEETQRRRRSEGRLREQAMLLDKARDAIIATDLDHRITYWNASAERIYGWKADEVAARRLEELELHIEPARFAAARRALEEAGEWRGDLRLQRRDGTIIQVESSWSLVRGADERPGSILFIDTDVTERKKLEAQLLRSERLDSIGMLAGGIAHDLNNALAPVLMAAELLRMRLTGPDLRIVDNIETSAQHGAALVRQLLAFARGTESRHTEIEVEELIHDVGKLIRSTLSRTIELEVGSQPSLRRVCADSTKLKQVLVNLCLNARDAMPQGGRIEIRAENVRLDASQARAHPGAEAGPHVRIGVRDNGSGIPPAVIDRIFDPFFTTKPVGKGTGLGLSMVAGIIKSHGGFLNVESQPGQGALFEIFLPATGDRAEPAVA